MKIIKMHGIGNDYVYVNGFDTEVSDPPALARKVSDRHFGVGGDGLIIIRPPSNGEADCRMEMYNADGSRAQMCGNGIRCVGKFVRDHGIVTGDRVRVETDSGLLELQLRTTPSPDGVSRTVESVTVKVTSLVPVSPSRSSCTSLIDRVRPFPKSRANTTSPAPTDTTY